MLQVGFTILAQHWDNIEMLPGLVSSKTIHVGEEIPIEIGCIKSKYGNRQKKIALLKMIPKIGIFTTP